VSSIEPNDGCDELNGGEEVAPGLVVAGGDGTELLVLGEEVLNQMPSLEEMAVVVSADLTTCPRWNDRRLAGSSQQLKNAFIGIECLVGDQRVGLHAWQQVIGADEIVRLTSGEEEAEGITECIDQGVDFGAQPAARPADRLVFLGFFCAPALC